MDNDERFAQVAKDPRFHKMARSYRKVKIDKRFEGMMKDDQFKVKYTVDPRGRPINATSNENLRRFYDLSSEDEDSEDEETKSKKKKTKELKKKKKEELKLKKKKEVEQSSSEGDEEDKEQDEEEENEQRKEKEEEEETDEEEEEEEEDGSEEEEEDSDDDDSSVDYARGQGNVESSTEEEFSDEESEGEELDHGWNEVDKTAVLGVDSTHRLAVCNMNWDRMKAVDLFVLLSSFLPSGGVLQSVTILPSEFGQERMAEEEASGPREFREEAEKREREADDEEKKGGDNRYHRERLREYQLNRLKYYYAVAEFDNIETADHIYQNCDRIEYESSASRLDLRFIPDDMTFDQEPSSRATEFPDSATYVPSKFLTDALQQSKVHLTWDETDQDRVAFTMKNFSQEDIEDMDVKAYLASDSDGDDDDGVDPYAGIEEPDFGEVGESSKQALNDDDNDDNEETQIEKYRALLKGLKDAEVEKEEEEKDMEITWEPGLKEATEDLVTTKEDEEEDQTPWDSYLDDRKQKKKSKKKEKVEAAKSKAEKDGPSVQAFSDDDLPDDLKESVAKDGKKKRIRKKKGKPVPVTAEEAKQAEELSLLLMDENEEEKGAKHFSLSAIQEAELLQTKKRKRKKLIARGETVPEVDDFKVDVEDSRFNELFDNPLYNIDPSATEYKKTNAMEALVVEKVKRRRLNKFKPVKKTEEAGDEKTNASLSSLVNSVKAKTKSIQERKKKSLLPK